MTRTYRGVVFEKQKKYTVFLTEKGEFLRGVPIGGTSDIGDEVDFHLVETPSLLNGKVKPRFVGGVMIAVVLLISIVASLIPINDEVMAYVQLETDKAMELGVNETGMVISLRYLNDTTTESENSLDRWKGDSISKVLDTAVNELSADHSGEQVNITIIYENTNSKEKVQRIVGSAVQEVRIANKELTMKIGESTAEERVKANEHEMSVTKFKESQQLSPHIERKPSSEVDEEIKQDSVNEQKGADENSVRQSPPTVPSNEKNNGNGNVKNKNPKSENPDTKQNKGQEQKINNSPPDKGPGKSTNSERGNGNSNKGNPNSTSKQPKDNKNQSNKPNNANGQ